MSIVKITYSSNLDDVPKEIAGLLASLQKQLKDISASVKTSSSELLLEQPNVEVSISKIDDAIAQFDLVDVKLKDCKSILSGYVNILKSQQPVEQPLQEESKEESKKKSTK